MGNVLVQESSLQAIAGAIRYKTGGTDTYKPREMAPAIRNLPGTGVMQNLSVTENGTYTPGAGVDGYDFVSVAVPNSALTSVDEGKVVVSGALMPQTSLNVSTNGTYDTTTKNSVVVNVSGGGGGSSTILYGDTAPSSSQGQNGDIYLKIIGSNLPSGAVQVEYIASTGTQWINTGYLGKANSRYMADVYIESSQSAGSPAVFGGRTGHKNRAATFFVFDFFAGQWNNQEVRSGTISPAYKEIRMTIEMDQDGYTVTNANGNSVSCAFTATEGGTEFPIALFGTTDGRSDAAGGLTKMKLYRFSIYESNTLVHDFFPCKNANNEGGVYDIVSGVFYTNSGSGSFNLGPVVSDGQTCQYVSDAYVKISGEWEPLINTDIASVL